jgi:hypothetical protein
VNPVALASVNAGQNITIPAVLDMSGAAGENVAALTFRLNFDPSRFTFVSASNGTYGSVTANTSAANTTGQVDVSVFGAEGATTTQTLYSITLQAKATASAVSVPVWANVTTAANDAGVAKTVTPRLVQVTIIP